MSREMQQQKAAMRKMVQEREAQLSADQKAASNLRIAEGLQALPEFRQGKVIFCFVGTAAEVDTWPIIQAALNQGKRVCVPMCISRGIMEAREISCYEDLQPGRYGIMEPREGCPCVAAAILDFVVVPCVTCNSAGHRLGYGGGFYDRYLAAIPDTPKAVLCRTALMEQNIPMDSHDAVIGIVVTDEGTLRPDER